MVLLAGWLVPNRTYTQLTRPNEPDTLFDGDEALSDTSAAVKELGAGCSTVDAELLHTYRGDELETLAIPPGEVTVDLPPETQPGQLVTVSGPHGRCMQVDAPSYARPGGRLQVKLAPRPELKVQLPPGKRPGDQIKVARASGGEVLVTVPEGAQPGGFFQAAPPALMVAVPDGSKPGDLLVFRHCEAGPGGGIKTKYCRARVPDELQFGRYFAARLPRPKVTEAVVAPRRFWGAGSTQLVTPAHAARVWSGTLA
mmetsp:Transcript_78948/g.223431  ORF Transcript_78948/g.223431 Transcript_78948/m.223431 type:complete len:255 (+) Transcript_78948:75-839(+)